MKQFYTILKGFHYSNFIPSLLRLKNSGKFCYDVTFIDNCRYNIDEKSCVNKVFGFCIGLLGVHKDSARFGWTYSIEHDKIELWSYIYTNGALKKNKIGEIEIGKKHKLSISYIIGLDIDGNNAISYTFSIDQKEIYQFTTPLKVLKKFLLTLGFYFGGKTRAPHKMKIIIK